MRYKLASRFFSVLALSLYSSILISSSYSKQIDISEEYAVVKDVYSSESPFKIYFIQDAHCNYEAQMNIYKTINSLIDKEGANLITMEGAEGEISPDDLRDFPYEETKKIVSSYFVKNGFINGVEYYAINTEKPVKVMGIEERELYQRNYSCLVNAIKNGGEKQLFSKFEEAIEPIKNKIYSDDIKILDSLEHGFDSNGLSMGAYLSKVFQLSNGRINFDKNYPNLINCFKMLDIEKQLNIPLIEKDRAKLVNILTQTMPKDEVTDFLQENMRFRLSKISYLNYLEYVAGMADKYKIDISAYKQLSSYYNYLKIHKNINQDNLFVESNSIRDDLFNLLCQNDEQRTLRHICAQARTLKKAFSLNLSSREWRQISGKLFFDDDSCVKFLKINGFDLVSLGIPEKLKISFEVIKNFYNCAEKRDSAIVENTLAKMMSLGLNRAIIVAGGYHSDGVCAKLRDKGISYVVLSPKLTKEDKNNPYTAIVSGKNKSNIEDFFSGRKNTLALASWLDNNPLINIENKVVFGKMFKSMLVSTLAWQMTGYDIISVYEVNLPILRSVKSKINEVLSTIKYDIKVVEIMRVDSQIYVRLRVDGQDIVYGLFADQPSLDWSKVEIANIKPDNVLTNFQLLGGSVIGLSLDQYKNVVKLAAQKALAMDEGSSTYMVRSVFEHPLSENIVKVLGIVNLSNKKLEDINSTASVISSELAKLGYTEDKNAIIDYLRNMIASYQSTGKLRIDDGKLVFAENLLLASGLAQKMVYFDGEGSMIPITSPETGIKIEGGFIKSVYLPKNAPISVIEKLIALIYGGSIKNGSYELGKSGGEFFNANILRSSEGSFFVIVSGASRPAALQSLEELYENIFGDEVIGIESYNNIYFVMESISKKQKKIYLAVMSEEGSNLGVIGPTIKFDLARPQSFDLAVEQMSQWVANNQIDIKNISGKFDSKHQNYANLLKSIFAPSLPGISPFEQVEEFTMMLDSYKFAASHNLNKSITILSNKIIGIIKENNPRYPIIKQALSGEINADLALRLGISKDNVSLIYHIYLHYLNYNPNKAGLADIPKEVLSNIIKDFYLNEPEISPDSAQTKLVEVLRGGKYLSKLDLSYISDNKTQSYLNDIFSNVSDMDIVFKNAGVSFLNTKRIRIAKSRLGGIFTDDFKVIIEDYSGEQHTLRLRVLSNGLLKNLFFRATNMMKNSIAKDKQIFPEIYYVRSNLPVSAAVQDGTDKISLNYYFAEHIEGILGDRILTHPDEFTDGEKNSIKFEGIRAWMKLWNFEASPPLSPEEKDSMVSRVSDIMLPATLDSVAFPESGANPYILGTGYSTQFEPVTFYDLLYSITTGFRIKKDDFPSIISNAVVSVFGIDEGLNLLTQALNESRAKEFFLKTSNLDLNTANIMAMIQNIQFLKTAINRDSIQKLIEVVYKGNELEAVSHISNIALKKGVSPIDIFTGQVSKWERKMPSVGEAKGLIKQKKPSVLTVTGGTGGNSLINAIKSGEIGNVVNLVATFDSGGQSYLWQDTVDPLVGYVYPKGDITNVAIAYLDDAKQDLLNKRLPSDTEITSIFDILEELITPTLNSFPKLKDSPEFIINFIDIAKKIDEFISVLRAKHAEDPFKYRNIDLRKGSIKNLFQESIDYFAKSYNIEEGVFDLDRNAVALYMTHELLGLSSGLVLPISTDEGDLVARLNEPIPPDKIPDMVKHMDLGTKISRNQIPPNGTVVFGEHYIGEAGDFIDDFGSKVKYLDIVRNPDKQDEKPGMAKMAKEALNYPTLDLVLVGPGSLFTSLLANFTLKDFVDGLVIRGKQQLIKYPKGDKRLIEPVKRVFIMNPVHSPEDKGLSVTDIIQAIERTARNASGNPDLKFSDMFDAVIMNDPAKAPQPVKDFIRKKKMDMIKPTAKDIHFLKSMDVESYSFSMVTIQKRPTRKAGFVLSYDEKLEYSHEMLEMIAKLSSSNIRAQKMENRVNIGIGNGNYRIGDNEIVTNAIRTGNVKPLPTNSLFYEKGIQWLEMSIGLLNKKIKHELDSDVIALYQADLNILTKAVMAIKNQDMKIYTVQPKDGSRGIFIDDLTHYQFTSVIESDQKGVKNGVYISLGLFSAVEDYFRKASLPEGNLQAATLYNNKASAIAAEVLFQQFAEWVAHQEHEGKFDFFAVHQEVKRIGEEHLNMKRPVYGSYLYEELSRLVNFELTGKDFEGVYSYIGIRSDMPIDKKISMLEDTTVKVNEALRIKSHFLEIVEPIPDKINLLLNDLYNIGDHFRDTLNNQSIINLLNSAQVNNIDGFLRKDNIAFVNFPLIFNSSIESTSFAGVLSALNDISYIMLQINLLLKEKKPLFNDDERALYDKFNVSYNDLQSLVDGAKVYIDLISNDIDLRKTLNLLQIFNSSQVEEALSKLNLIKLSKSKEDKTVSTPLQTTEPETMETIAVLDSMSDTALEKWVNQNIYKLIKDDVKKLKNNFTHFMEALDNIINHYPDLKNALISGIPMNADQNQRAVINAIIQIGILDDNKSLDTYTKVVDFGIALNDRDMAALLSAIDQIIGKKNIPMKNLLQFLRDMFLQIDTNYKDIKNKLNGLQAQYPSQFERLLMNLVNKGEITSRTVGLSDGHYSESPAKIAHIILKGNVKRIYGNDKMIHAVKERINTTALNLMMQSKSEHPETVIKLQAAASLLFRIYSVMNNNQYNFWSVEPADKNPALFIDDLTHFQFATLKGDDIYFSQGLVDRFRYLWDRGEREAVIGMLSESVAHIIGEGLIEKDMGVDFDTRSVHDLVKEYGAYLSPKSPLSSLGQVQETMVFSEMKRIAEAYLNNGIKDVTLVPVFSYPSDNELFSRNLRDGLVSGKISGEQFLDIIIDYFKSKSQLGGVDSLLYNGAYFRTGEVFGYVRDFPLNRGADVSVTHTAYGNRIIDLSKSSDENKLKAKEVIKELLSNDKYRQYIGSLTVHELEDIMYDIIRLITGDNDPYRLIKDEYNQKGMDALAVVDNRISQSKDRLLASILVAIAGNALDFADEKAAKELDKKGFYFADEISKILQPDQPVVRNDYALFMEKLKSKPNQRIAYSIDNAGEIITDFPLLKLLLSEGHTVTMVTRDKNTMNDVSYRDALDLFAKPEVRSYFVDSNGASLLADGKFSIITSGSNITGTDMRRVTPEFIKVWSESDIRILKGQGNYETLKYTPLKHDAFFFVKVKDPASTQGKHAKGDVLIEYKKPNQVIDSYVNGNLGVVLGFIKPRLNNEESDIVKEFINFYIDYLDIKANEWLVSHEKNKITKTFSEAQTLFDKINGIPELNSFLLDKIKAKLEANTNLENFIWQVLPAESAATMFMKAGLPQHFIVIDLDSIPSGDLTYASEILKSLSLNRQKDTDNVKWVIFSDKLNTSEVIESLITRNFFWDKMEVIGKNKYDIWEHRSAKSYTHQIEGVIHYIQTDLAGASFMPSSVKVLTKDEGFSKYAAENGMFVFGLPNSDSLSSVTDFISALVSADSLIYGGKMPDLSIQSIDSKDQYLLSDLTAREGGFVNPDWLKGRILSIKPARPRKERLNEIEFKRDLEKAI